MTQIEERIMSIRDNLAVNLKSHRVRMGLSQTDLARKANLSFATVQNIERKTTHLSVQTLVSLATVFGINESELLEDCGE